MLRKRMGISQTEMSKRSGVSLGSIKRFESSGKISLESLLKLAAVLNRLEDFEEIFLPKESADIDALFSDKMRKS
jgi:transcriptional regulator with XRE-family HTH domain